MKILTALSLTLCLAAPIAAQTTTAPAADVVGTWDVTVTTAQGQTIPSQLKLRKDAAKLVGTISSDMGESPVEAEVKGKTLSVWFNFQAQGGTPMAIEMAGTVEGDSVKGTMAVGGQAGGEWVASRVKDAASKEAAKAPATTEGAPKADLTGTWDVAIELPNMTANPSLVLKQDGEKLTGEYVSAQYGKFPVTGTVKGADASFWFEMKVEGNALNVTYTAKVEKDGSLKGSVTYGDMMSGTFIASKKK